MNNSEIKCQYLEKLTNVNKVVSKSWTTIKGPSTRIKGTLKKTYAYIINLSRVKWVKTKYQINYHLNCISLTKSPHS